MTRHRTGPMTHAAYLCGYVAGFDATSQFFIFPDIRDRMAGGDSASASWTLTIAGIIGAVALLQAGRLCDRYGHDRVLVVAAGLLGFGSVFAALSPTLTLLVAARGVQAAALATLGVSSFAVIVRDTPPDRLTTVMGTWGFWTGLSGVTGPVLAGAAINGGSWRTVYLAETIIAVALLLMANNGAGERIRKAARGGVDIAGSVLVAVGLALIVLALLEGNDWGWASPLTLGALTTGLLMLAAVVHRSRSHPDPVLPLEPFSSSTFVVGSLTQSTANLGFYAMWLALLLFMTEIWDWSVLRAGLLLTLMPGGMSLLSIHIGRYADRVGPRRVVPTGGFVTAAGFAVTALIIGEDPSVWRMLPAVLCAGIGMAAMLPPTSSAATATLAAHQVGSGTAILQTLGRVTGGLGPATVVALLAADGRGELAAHRRTIWFVAVTIAVAALIAMKLPDRSEASTSAA